ncbi:regenerating islet-derived protein 4-like [Latimeria chalumnae]|uniref:regenerating islet-derived protein 4-like n=1 Tax=Latimeria chalumnae TaxID=7897 RepID=UPI0003C11AAD|nr:PREDICTED: regenerating islet-derived protein 4-like [Latimeria chalumnae]|eukprot:XP_006010465.1 PREDICTED: regenerating islet-derived protein 4-like [Latimeria chalumnae]
MDSKIRCPSGWFIYLTHCYGYFEETLSWEDAEKECVSYGLGTHLASVHNFIEGALIASFISQYQNTTNVWIGGQNNKKAHQWEWKDGSPFKYKSWKKGKPSCSAKGHTCMELTAAQGLRKWSDSACHNTRPFVCKFLAKTKMPASQVSKA